MTENLYESDQFNHTNGTCMFQHSPRAPHYVVPNVTSLGSPRLSHQQLTSPVAEGNELSPLLEMSNGEGTWDYSQFERPVLSPWGSSQEELSESTGAPRIHPFNVMSQNESTLTSKDSRSGPVPQRLDSFSKAFPSKNIQLLFEDSIRRVDKNSEDNHISGVLQEPESETFSEGSDRQPLESPSLNLMSVHGQTQTIFDQPGFHPSDSQNSLHGLYQTHQHFHYGYQQHKQKVTNTEQVNRGLQKPQSSWLHQHSYPSPLISYPMTFQLPQQQLHLQHREMFAHKTHLDCPEGKQSPIYSHDQDFKSPEQQNFQSHSLSLLSPHYQDQHQAPPLSHQSSVYLHQHPQEHTQSISTKQSNMFHEGHLSLYDKHSAPNTTVFSSPSDNVHSGFNFPHRSENICSAQYSVRSSGVQKTVPQTAIFHPLTSHAPQWTQASSPEIQEEINSQDYRAEIGVIRGEGSHAKMRCTVCQRQFKSLPALNGHMRSHGGFRTHPPAHKMRDEQIHLSSEVCHTNPIILPVSVPVRNCQMAGPQYHQKDDDQNTQSPLPSQNHTSCRKTPVLNGECGSKQGKKRNRQCLVPLMIPGPGTGQESRGAVLFRSLLRTPSSMTHDVPYTPPPMLSPVRPGSGLFSAVNGRNTCSGTQSVANMLNCATSEAGGSSMTSDKKVIHVTPRINIGEEFQAKIPEISQTLIEEDTHNAVLLWMPTKDMNTSDHQQKVDNLLKLACSSVLPGGGTNTEFVLHCLFECRGDIMNTVEKLLFLWRKTSSPRSDYHYAGSDSWSPQEKRQLNKALLTHHKDFHHVQKLVKTKSVAQCVEYYYTWKKRLRLGTRVSSALSSPVQQLQGDWTLNFSTSSDKERKSKMKDNCHILFIYEQMNGKQWNQNNVGLLCNSPAEHRTSTVTQPPVSTSGDPDSAPVFPCTECGKVFLKVKSRNAHMKTHRQYEDTHLWPCPRIPEQDRVIMASGCVVTPLKQPINLSDERTAEVKTFVNDLESVQDDDGPLKAVLQRQLDYISS